MFRTTTILLIASTLCFACHERNENKVNSPTANDDELHEFLKAYYQCMSDRNWEQYRSFFTSQATLNTVWQQNPEANPELFCVTIDDFIQQTPQGPDSEPIFKESMTGAEIEQHGIIASAWVDYEAEFGKPDSLIHWKGKDLFSLIKSGDEWKITSITYASEEQ